jgi:hypothetical protein
VLALADIDPADLTPRDQLRYLQATECVMGWLARRQQTALVAFAGGRSRVDHYELPDARVISIEELDVAEVAVAARWPESFTADRVATARLVEDPLPCTGEALHRGRISLRHAEVIAAGAQRLQAYAEWLTMDPVGAGQGDERAARERFRAACIALEDVVVPIAERSTVATTRKAVERALLRIDAEYTPARRQHARSTRDVWITAEADGMAVLLARLGIEEAQACMAALGPAAGARVPGIPAGAARADALVGRLIGSDSPDVPGRIGTHLDVTVSLDALLGLTAEPAQLRPAEGPGSSAQSVPASVDLVRELLRQDPDATMRRLVVEPMTGHLLDRGRSRYAIPQVLREFVISRDETCRFPGCSRPASAGDIDHVQPWAFGGATDRANLGALCRRHHLLKTHAGWRLVDSRVDGSCRWESPHGLTHDGRAHPAWPDPDPPPL